MKNLKKTILTQRSDWCVSLYIPTHRAGRKVEQNVIRFKNQLQEAEKQLLAKGLRAPAVKEMLKKPQKLLDDSKFWQHQSDGLAVFFSEDDFHFYKFPIEFTEVLAISSRFHIKPLLPFLTQDNTFYVLAISQNKLRLLEGTEHSVEEIDLGDIPETLADTFPDGFPKKGLSYHTGTTSTGVGGGARGAMFFGHDPSNDMKKHIQRWFRAIDAALTDLIADSKSPLVLAGVDSLFPLYKEINTYPQLMAEGVPGNPDVVEPDKLRQKAWAIVEPVFNKKREAGLAQYTKMVGTGQTTTDITKAVIAAHHGQIDVLFVAVGVQVWGQFNVEENKVEIRDVADTGDTDLLNYVAIQALIKGADVFVVSKDEMPGGALVAAVLRY